MSLTRRLLFGSHPRRTAVRIALLASVSFVTFGWILIPMRADGISMLPAYRSGSLHLVNRFAFAAHRPRRGDVIAIRLAGPHVLFVKRVVALPGEQLEIVDGQVYVNGSPLSEPYVRNRRPWNIPAVTLSSREYLRNRRQSGDARARSRIRTRRRLTDPRQGHVLMGRRAAAAVAVAVIAVAAYVAWRAWYSDDEREIRAQLASLAAEFNASTTDGFGTVARAAQLGSYFSDDIVVDLGPGSALIEGRPTLIGMAARLQPRTAAFRVAMDDVGIEVLEEKQLADVTLTVSFIRRSVTTGEESTDAREFALQMRQADGRWQIARATAVDTFRQHTP